MSTTESMEHQAKALERKVARVCHRLPPRTRKLVTGVLGGLLLLAGLAMVVLPGPALVFIPLGLLVLSAEFEWSRRLLHAFRERFQRHRRRRRA